MLVLICPASASKPKEIDLENLIGGYLNNGTTS